MLTYNWISKKKKKKPNQSSRYLLRNIISPSPIRRPISYNNMDLCRLHCPRVKNVSLSIAIRSCKRHTHTEHYIKFIMWFPFLVTLSFTAIFGMIEVGTDLWIATNRCHICVNISSKCRIKYDPYWWKATANLTSRTRVDTGHVVCMIGRHSETVQYLMNSLQTYSDFKGKFIKEYLIGRHNWLTL